MKLDGKRILVTGATGGIGGALAQTLRARGAAVIVHGRDHARLDKFARNGFEVVESRLDDHGAAEALVQRVLAVGPLDILINNAGVQEQLDFRSTDVESQLTSIDRELDVNLRAPVVLTRLLLPTLLARPVAAVVNITSGLALVPKQSAPVYCATKAALHSFSTTLRWQLEGTSVDVFEALPPLVDTAMTRGRDKGKISPEQCAREIVHGLERDRHTILIGKTALLAILVSMAPFIARRIMRHG